MLEKLYKIEQPNIAKIKLRNFQIFLDPNNLDALAKTELPEYLHWKDIKHKNWIPSEFKNNKEEFWAMVKFFRRGIKTPISDKDGKSFTWRKLSHYEKMLHEMTLDMSRYLLNFSNISDADRSKYKLQGITEEAIASSQLEGAHSTRKAAMQMIRENREPKTFAEKMIFNNFLTMRQIQEKYKDEKLSLEMLFSMHSMLTKDTIDDSDHGNFRKDEDQIVIQKGDDPMVITYIAPPIKFVEKEILKLIDFANDELEEDNFIHPVVKAIMIHFWIGLLHPFVDGNGRLARGLFYWYLLRKGYWAFALLPISLVIKNSPDQYAESYVLSEQDDNDLTYFIDYNLRKISQAIDNFRKFYAEKSRENAEVSKIVAQHKNLNSRQIEALNNLHKNPNHPLTVTIYKNIFNVAKVTAIKDLKWLMKDGFVVAEKKGRHIFYSPTKKANDIRF